MRSEHTDLKSLLWANHKALSELFMVSYTANRVVKDYMHCLTNRIK